VSLLLDPSPADDLLTEPEQWEQTIADIADTLIGELEQAGVADAKRLGCRLTLHLCKTYGGATYYLPRGDSLRRAERNMTIWRECDHKSTGDNSPKALAQRYGLSEIHIYRILADQLDLHRRKRQAELAL